MGCENADLELVSGMLDGTAVQDGRGPSGEERVLGGDMRVCVRQFQDARAPSTVSGEGLGVGRLGVDRFCRRAPRADAAKRRFEVAGAESSLRDPLSSRVGRAEDGAESVG